MKNIGRMDIPEDSRTKEKNRGRDLRRHHRHHHNIGNVKSFAAGPGRTKNDGIRRLIMHRQLKEDLKSHIIVDRKLPAHPLSRKTTLQTAIFLDDHRMPNHVNNIPANNQGGQRGQGGLRDQRSGTKIGIPWRCRFSLIHPKLYIANVEWYQSRNDDQSPYSKTDGVVDVILNLSGFPLHRTYGTRVINCRLPEFSATLTQLLHAGDTLARLLDERTHGRVTVVCHAGINRSSAVVVAYAVLHRGFTVAKAEQYVELTKYDEDRRWHTLTSGHLRRLLRTVYPQVSPS